MATSADLTTGETKRLTKDQWIVLVASFLGWMFDGVEIGLFPLVVRPALQDLGMTDDKLIAWWNSVVVACFLLGAAAGGVVFGWLGDKMGRVRSMVLSVLAYSLFTGACYFATAPWQLGVFRFIASMGMGGEWALAVALVMECWPERHRPKLAGAIGAAANFGFLFIALVALTKPVTRDSWRWMMLVGASPAVLALFIILLVPESERWKQSVKSRLAAAAGRAAVLPGLLNTMLLAGFFLAVLLAQPLWASIVDQRLVGLVTARLLNAVVLVMVFLAATVVARRPGWFLASLALGLAAALGLWNMGADLGIALVPAVFAIGSMGAAGSVREIFSPGLRKATLFAIVFSAVPLIGTWAAVSGWIPVWVDQMTQIEGGRQYLNPQQLAQFNAAETPEAKLTVLKAALTDQQWKEVRDSTARSKAWVQLMLSIGAIMGCFAAPLIGAAWGRRAAYSLLCLVSLVSCGYLFWFLKAWTAWFMVVAWFVGGVTAAFYGFLPLYLPELFPTRVRATGQGLSFNFGRILAAAGVFWMAYLVAFFGDYAKAMGAICSVSVSYTHLTLPTIYSV